MDTGIEDTKTTTILMLQIFLNPMQLFLHDTKDQKGHGRGSHVQPKPVHRSELKNRFFRDSTKSIPVLAIASLQDSSPMLCKRPVDP